MNTDSLKSLYKIPFRLLKNWRSEWGNLGLIILPVLLSLTYFTELLESNSLYTWIAIFLIVICWIQTNHNKDQLQDLRTSVSLLEHETDILQGTLESIPQIVLQGFYDELGFSYSDRITIYHYRDEKFFPVGRYAKSPELKKSGRSEYPKDKGFISLAWKSGQFLIEDLPDYNKEPNVYKERVLEVSGMGKGIVKELSMKSRCYYCVNLDDAHSSPVGVIVFESLCPELPIEKKRIDFILNSEIGKVLVKTMEANIPAGRE